MREKSSIPPPTVRAAAAFDVADMIRRLGHDPEPIFSRAGICMNATHDPYRKEELGRFTYLLDLAAEITSCLDLGMSIGIQQDPAKWGAFGYLVLNSPTVGTALSNVAAFMHPWQSGTHVACPHTHSAFGFEYSITHPAVTHKAQDAELSLGYIKHLVDLLCNRKVILESLHFEHRQIAELSVYRKTFGIEPLFNQSVNRIMFPEIIESWRVKSADLNLYPVLRQHLIDMANATPRMDDLLGLVFYEIRQLLPIHECSLRSVATALALDPQALQRRLKSHDRVFAEMVEETRRKQAIEFLHGNHLEIKEIAYMLGYGDPSAFVKAFRRWTGKTPGQYREEIA